ncbi:MAG TPA: exonuclease domain-containing protein [Balneolaceae bacterium]
MRFISLDFETANRERGSVCQVGLAIFEKGSLVESKSWLIKPYNNYFDDINKHIHGITEQHVVNSPSWNDIWPEVNNYINNSLIIAHNASFDISVLRHVLDIHSIRYPTLDYICSYLLAKNIWNDLLSYKLSYLAKIFKIDLNHHDALSDAIAAGKILLRGMEALNVSNYKELQEKLCLRPGSVYERSYITPQIKKIIDDIEEPQLEVNDGNNPFKNKTIVFTGALGYLTRKRAKKLVERCGGITKTSVSKKVDILIVGEADIEKYGEGYKTNKLKKAEKLLRKGHKIELIGENDFLSFCHWAEDKVSL